MSTVNYTSSLGLALPTQGDLSGQWGTEVNNYITTYLDSAIAGALAITLTGNITLTKSTGTTLGSTSSQYAILNVTPSASTWTITAPAASQIYHINNLSSTYTFTFKASGQSGFVVAAAEKCVVAYNGTDFVKISSSGGSALFADLTLSGGTANGVAYLNASKVVTTGTALSWDATTFSARGTTASTITTGTTTNRGSASNVGLLTFTAPNASGTATTWGGIRSFTGSASAGAESSSLYFSNMQAGVATDAMVLNTSGNLGLGATPSSWASFYKGFDVSTYSAVYGASTNNAGLINNGFFNGTKWIYKNTAAATNYNQSGGAHSWSTAASGIGGNEITFFQAMTLDSGGRLLVGTTTANGSALIQIGGFNTSSGNPDIFIGRTGASESATVGNGCSIQLQNLTNSTACIIQQYSNNLQFFNYTGSGWTERMRLDSSGNLLVGAASVSNSAGWDKLVQIYATNYPALSLKNSYRQWDVAVDGNTGALRFWDATAAAERMRLDSSGNLLLGKSTSSSFNGRLAVSGTTGNSSIGTLQSSGTGALDTLISINQGEQGGCLLLLASRNTSSGASTDAAVYIVRFYYGGNNAPTTTYVGGSSDFVTFGVSGSNTLTVQNNGGGNVAYSWFGNK